MKHKRKLLLSVILTFAVVAGILFPLMTAHAADDVYTVIGACIPHSSEER